MTKLQILQMILVTSCILIYTTPADAIEHENEFRQMMRKKVIDPLCKWAKSYHNEQFGVLLLTDFNLKDWESFKPIPNINIKKKYGVNKRAQPIYNDRMFNYYAALPLNDVHSEDRVLLKYDTLLKEYKKYKFDPKHVVLYTYFLPCPDCTNIITKFYVDHANHFNKKGIDFIVAYSADTGLNYLKPDETIDAFEKNKIKHVKIPLEHFMSRINRE